MRRLLVLPVLTVALALVGLPTAPAQADGALTLSANATKVVGTAPQGPNFRVTTFREGHWVLDAQVEQAGSPVAGVAPLHAEGETTGSPASFDLTLSPAGLTSGVYQLAGTVTVTASDGSGDYTGTFDSGFTVDLEAPDGTVTLSRPWFRLNSSGWHDPLTVTSTGTTGEDRYLSVVNAAGTEVYFKDIFETAPGSGTWQYSYDGVNSDGLLLPRGTYTLRVVDAARNIGPTTTFAVQRLVAKTYTRTLTATGSRVASYVGRCSTLRSPASRGWTGSFGYYANTRCRSTADADTTVLTRHRMAVPAAAKYTDVQLKTYSGASKGYAGDIGVLLYEPASTSTTTAPAQLVLGGAVTTRSLPRVAASKVLRSISGRKYVYWNAGTAHFQHYDIKTFTVVVRYQVWA